MKSRILVVGSANTDMILQVPRLPRPGETVLGGTYRTAAGGKGANQAVSAARAGGAVTLIARVGRDPLGDQALAAWQQDHLDTRWVTRDPQAPSGVALILVGRDGENSIAVAPGANAQLSPADVQRARGAFRTSTMLLLQLETPLATVAAASRIARECGVPVILNPAPARPLPRPLLRRISVLTPNETEAELLTGIRVGDVAGAKAAARRLRQWGVPTVVLTLGARGALVATADMERLIPGFRVRAVDTTAAGDVFNGALAVALAEGRSLPEAVQFANAAAAVSVTRLGAQPSAPVRRDIERQLRAGASGRTGAIRRTG